MAGYLGTKAVFLSTTAGSVTGDMSVGGNVVLGDNSKAIFGAGSDLQIYHDGSNSYVSELGTGDLRLGAVNIRIGDNTSGASYIYATQNAEVSLYYNNSAKLATTATGVDVTGTVTADGLTVDTDTLYVDSTNNRVGIGTATPSNILHVKDTGSLIGKFEGGTAAYSQWVNSTGVAGYVGSGNGLGAGAATDLAIRSENSLVFITNGGSERLRITSSGNVGIGTSSPFGTATGRTVLSLNNTSDNRIGFGVSGTERQYFYGDATNLSIINTQSGYVRFSTSNTERMRIDSSGFVGIGTSSPQREVQIHDASSANAFLAINHTGVGSGATDGMLLGVDSSGDAIVHNYENTNMIFRTNDTERMRINSSGSLLVGTTTIVDANGAQFVNAYAYPETGSEFRTNSTLTHSAFIFRNPNGAVGAINTSGSSTSYNTSSDYRLKENVTPLDGASDRLAQIPVHRFNFIADPDTTVDGFLAHEVQAIVPEAVTGEKDAVDADGNPVYQGIDQSKLVPLLTAALQEALADIATLKAEVAALKEI